jgi:hypothetical protein
MYNNEWKRLPNPVSHLRLPAGSYLLHATLVIAGWRSTSEGIHGATVSCGLRSSIEPYVALPEVAQATVTPAGSGEGLGITQTLPVEAAYTAASEATITLECGTSSATGDEVRVRYTSFSAIEVQPLTVE